MILNLGITHSAAVREDNAVSPLYLLIELLDREAKLTAVTIRVVSDNKFKRIQPRIFRLSYLALVKRTRTRKRLPHSYSTTCSHLDGLVRVH